MVLENKGGAVEKKAVIDVPSSVELARQKSAGQHQPAGQGKKGSKKGVSKPVLAGVAVVLLVIVVFAALFLVPKYKYSFNISGVNFVSNDYTPSEFFPQFRDNNSFVVVADLKDGQSNAWVVNAMNLWLVALNSDGKSVQSLVRMDDSSGAIKSCSTNDANVLVSRDLPLGECSQIAADPSKGVIQIGISGNNSAVLSKNRLEVFASGTDTISNVNYYVIKQMYPDFDKTLAIVNERINSIKN